MIIIQLQHPKIDGSEQYIESYTFNFFYSGPSNIPSIDMTYQVADKVSSTDTQGIGGPRTHQDVRRSVKVCDIIAR